MKACIFDTETTGLIKNRTLKLDKQPSIIEFYGCIVNLKTGKVSKEFDTFIKPPKPLADKPAFGEKKTITEITGITNEMLEGAPTFFEVAPQIIKLFSGTDVGIAHNASFDKEMISIEMERAGFSLKWPRLICTVEQTVAIKGIRLSLSALHLELFDEEFKGAHRAKVDVQALTRCCVELFKRGLL